jgi:hypothetical protein
MAGVKLGSSMATGLKPSRSVARHVGTALGSELRRNRWKTHHKTPNVQQTRVNQLLAHNLLEAKRTGLLTDLYFATSSAASEDENAGPLVCY